MYDNVQILSNTPVLEDSIPSVPAALAAVTPLATVRPDPFFARIPGSKSLTNRALVIAAQRIGTTCVEGALHSDDTRHLARCLDGFGGLAVAETPAGFTVTRSREVLTAPQGALDAGGAATPARLLLAFAAAAEGATVVSGNSRLRERPMGDILRAFEGMGVRYECLGAPDCLPVRVVGGSVGSGRWIIDGGVSSQFTTALLILAAQQTARPAAPVTIEVTGHQVSRPYIAMTVRLLRDCGIAVEHDDLRSFRVTPGMARDGSIGIEPDASGASYFLAAAAITGATVIVPGLGRASAQGDVGFAGLLERMGAEVKIGDDEIAVRGGSLGGLLRGIDVDMEAMPDMVLGLAVTAALAQGPTTIRNIANLRLKECDRIAAAAAELGRLGVTVDEGSDSLTVHPPGRLGPGLVCTHDDHRVAMSFALLRLVRDGIDIEEPGCVAKSFPGFWEELARFCRHHHQPRTGQGEKP